MEHGGTLCAKAGRICGVFLVCALHNQAVFQFEGGPNLEMGIRRVTTFLGVQGGCHKFLVLWGHFLRRGEFLIVYDVFLVCHNAES
jgi:hypothetical protein